MTTPLDDKIVPKIADIINDVGISAILKVYAGQSVNRDTGEVTSGTATEYSVTISPLLNYDQMMIDNSTVLASDMRAFLSGRDAPVVPTARDKIVVDSAEYQIVAIKSLRSGDLVAAYEFQLRL